MRARHNNNIIFLPDNNNEKKEKKRRVTLYLLEHVNCASCTAGRAYKRTW